MPSLTSLLVSAYRVMARLVSGHSPHGVHDVGLSKANRNDAGAPSALVADTKNHRIRK